MNEQCVALSFSREKNHSYLVLFRSNWLFIGLFDRWILVICEFDGDNVYNFGFVGRIFVCIEVRDVFDVDVWSV